MVPVDRALTLREKQLQEALDLLIEKHGAQSETVALISNRLDDVRAQLVSSQIDRTHQESHTGNIITVMGGPQVKDGALLFIIIGMVMIVALGGMSTMFLLMMAVKW